MDVADGSAFDPYSLQCTVRSDINQREQNEDSFHIYDLHVPTLPQPLKVLALADGMGGHAYGEEVSRETLRKMSLAIFEQLCVDSTLNQEQTSLVMDKEHLEKVLWSGLEQANSYIRRMVQANKWGKAGSTLLVVLINGENASVLYLGDSPLFHYQSTQRRLRKISEDHTIAGALLRAKKITPEMALHHEGKSRLEFYVGAEALPKHRSITHFHLDAGDILLLCSDGVTGQLTHEAIEEKIALYHDNLITLSYTLFAAAREVGETDNQTAILWRQGNVPQGPIATQRGTGKQKLIHTEAADAKKKLPGGEPNAKKQFRDYASTAIDEETREVERIEPALQAFLKQKNQMDIANEQTTIIQKDL